MRYTYRRKLSLSKFYRIVYGKKFNRDLHGFETEDIEILEADSFDEAVKEAEKLIAEREGYHLARAQSQFEIDFPVADPVNKKTPPVPVENVAPTPENSVKVPGDPTPVPNATGSVQPGATSDPPAEFN